MEEPLNGAIARVLDLDDFAGLIQEHIITAGWHDERLTLALELAPEQPQQAHQYEKMKRPEFKLEPLSLSSSNDDTMGADPGCHPVVAGG